MRLSSILFLLLFLFVPTLAHADIFAQFSYNPGGCGVTSGFSLECSKNYDDGLFSAISCKVLTVFNRGIVPMYCNIVTSAEYISAIHAVMALFIIIWGISFIIGSVPTTTGSAFVNLLKMVFVYIFATNADVFFDFLYVTVLAIPSEMVGIILQNTDNGSGDFFSYVDKHFSTIFKEMVTPQLQGGGTQQKVDVRLFVLGIAVGKLVPGGGFITALFFTVISGWLMTYLMIMVRYVIAIMGLIFLLMLTPIFIPAKLFKAMEYLTDEWQRMIISFIIQIIVVVLYLIMVEPFFKDFLDLVKLGFNKIILERGYENTLVSQGKTMGGDTIESMFQEYGITMATAEKYVTELDYKGNEDEFIPWFVMKLLTASVMIYLSYKFMQAIPTFATLIAGNPKFVSMFQSNLSSNFGTSVSGESMPHEGYMGKFQNSLVKAASGNDSPQVSRGGNPSAVTRADRDAKANQAQVDAENR